MSFLDSFFRRPALESTRLREAPAPRAEINKVCDYVALATEDGRGKRIHEKDAKRTLKFLERL